MLRAISELGCSLLSVKNIMLFNYDVWNWLWLLQVFFSVTEILLNWKEIVVSTALISAKNILNIFQWIEQIFPAYGFDFAFRGFGHG